MPCLDGQIYLNVFFFGVGHSDTIHSGFDRIKRDETKKQKLDGRNVLVDNVIWLVNILDCVH